MVSEMMCLNANQAINCEVKPYIIFLLKLEWRFEAYVRKYYGIRHE